MGLVTVAPLVAQVVSWLGMAGFSASDRARLNIPILTENPLIAFRARYKTQPEVS